MSGINLDLKGTIAQAVYFYTGSQPEVLQCVPDPQVPGTYAFRATIMEVCDGKSYPRDLHFVTAGVALHRITADDLQECEFSEWPPVAR